MPSNHFKFRHFDIIQEQSPARVGTDGTLLGAWVAVEGAHRILDVGTGTGLIALMLAQRNKNAEILAVEKHEAAAAEAKMNFERSPWADRLAVLPLDVRDLPQRGEVAFDLIVSNPPFFQNDTLSRNADRNSWRKQGHLGIEELIRIASGSLAEGGRLALILPTSEVEAAIEIATSHGLRKKRICQVHFKPEKPARRILVEFTNHETPIPTVEEKLIIQIGGRHEYSAEYIALTRDFYPWME